MMHLLAVERTDTIDNHIHGDVHIKDFHSGDKYTDIRENTRDKNLVILFEQRLEFVSHAGVCGTPVRCKPKFGGFGNLVSIFRVDETRPSKRLVEQAIRIVPETAVDDIAFKFFAESDSIHHHPFCRGLVPPAFLQIDDYEQ